MLDLLTFFEGLFAYLQKNEKNLEKGKSKQASKQGRNAKPTK